MDAGTTWTDLFANKPLAATAAAFLLGNVAQFLWGIRERAVARADLREANKRCIDTATSVSQVAQQFAQAASAMRGGRRSSAVPEPDTKLHKLETGK